MREEPQCRYAGWWRRLATAALWGVMLFPPVAGASADVPRPADRQADPLASAVKHTIVKAAGEFQACYKAYLRQGGAHTPQTLTIDWRLTPTGQTAKTELVSSSVAASPAKAVFETCVVKQVAALDFPPTGRPEPTYHFHTFRFTDVETTTSVPSDTPRTAAR